MITKLIHSHHSMGSFFSGTDTQELVDNCVNHSYYVSLIVNNRNEMVARVAIAGKREVTSSSLFSFSGILGKIINFKKDTKNEESVMYYVDMEIEKESVAIDEFFMNKVKALKEKPVRTQSFDTFGFGAKGGFEIGRKVNPVDFKPVTHQQKEFDFQFEEKEEELPAPDILNRCLGGTGKETVVELLSDIMYNGTKLTPDEDIKFYLEQSLDQETVIEYASEYQRYFYDQPSLDMILNVFKRFRGIFAHYVHGEYGKVARMATSIVDKEIEGIKQTLSPL